MVIVSHNVIALGQCAARFGIYENFGRWDNRRLVVTGTATGTGTAVFDFHGRSDIIDYRIFEIYEGKSRSDSEPPLPSPPLPTKASHPDSAPNIGIINPLPQLLGTQSCRRQ